MSQLSVLGGVQSVVLAEATDAPLNNMIQTKFDFSFKISYEYILKVSKVDIDMNTLFKDAC